MIPAPSVDSECPICGGTSWGTDPDTGLLYCRNAFCPFDFGAPMTEQPNAGEARMEAALKPFGWACGPEFWQRYYSDPWVFNLANAVERLSTELEEKSLALIEARNPGIDMDEVRRTRGTRS